MRHTFHLNYDFMQVQADCGAGPGSHLWTLHTCESAETNVLLLTADDET